MKKSHKAIGVAFLVVLGAALGFDLVGRDARGLEQASQRAGLRVDCKIRRVDAERWGVCRYPNGAPASVWLQRGDGWASANGNAIEILEGLARLPADQLQGLPNLLQDHQNPPDMPADLLNR